MNFRFAKQPTNYLTMTRTFYIGDTRCKIGQGQLGGCHAFHDGFHFKENKWNKNALHAFIILFIKRQNDSSMLLDIQFLAKPPILHNSAHADCVRPLSIERIMSSRAYNAHEKWTRCFKLKFIIEEMWFGAIHASHYKLQNCVLNTENSVCLKCHFSKYIVIKIIERNTNVWLNQVSIEYETLNGSHNAMRCDTESHSIEIWYHITMLCVIVLVWRGCLPGWADDWQSKSWKWWILLGILLHNESRWTFELKNFQQTTTKWTHNTYVFGFAIK